MRAGKSLIDGCVSSLPIRTRCVKPCLMRFQFHDEVYQWCGVPVPWRQDCLLTWPRDPQLGVVPFASEFVCQVPIVCDRIEVEGSVVELEPVSDARRDHDDLRG